MNDCIANDDEIAVAQSVRQLEASTLTIRVLFVDSAVHSQSGERMYAIS